MSDRDDEPVPRLPRGTGLRLDGQMLFRIAATAALLVMVVLTARPCGEATSKFVTGFGEDGSAKPQPALPRPGTVDVPRADNGSAGDYERISPNMSEAEVKAAIERAKAKAAGAGSSAP